MLGEEEEGGRWEAVRRLYLRRVQPIHDSTTDRTTLSVFSSSFQGQGNWIIIYMQSRL